VPQPATPPLLLPLPPPLLLPPASRSTQPPLEHTRLPLQSLSEVQPLPGAGAAELHAPTLASDATAPARNTRRRTDAIIEDSLRRAHEAAGEPTAHRCDNA
jgi:hypothetical protein